MRGLVIAAMTLGCGSSPERPPDAPVPPIDGVPAADWVVDAGDVAGRVSPALLGQYDLSGSLFHYPANGAAIAKMRAIGFDEWRVGVGRWEIATRQLPALADGVNTPCPGYATAPEALRAPPGATDATLVADRDWFVDTGAPVTLADTDDGARYALGYVRSVIDAAAAFGAQPFVDIDHMPRALAVNRGFFRGGTVEGLSDPCLGTWSNHVSNARPASPAVFAAAVVGMVRRVVEGSAGEPPRAAPYWEIWNEPELGYAWDKSFEPTPGTLSAWFEMALTTLVRLDGYRAGSTKPDVTALRFGLGSFANASTAAGVVHALDTTPLPGGAFAPLDFLSFHAYANDPLAILANIQMVTSARAASTHYHQLELVLSEWGPDLGQPPPAAAIDTALLVATVLARAPALGVTRTHHSLFVDFIPPPGLPFTLLAADGTAKPLYHAYTLLHDVIGAGADRLAVAGAPDGALDGGEGAVLVTRDAGGTTRALIVHRGATARTVRLDLGGAAVVPSRVRVYDDPSAPPRELPPAAVVTVPARAIAELEY